MDREIYNGKIYMEFTTEDEIKKFLLDTYEDYIAKLVSTQEIDYKYISPIKAIAFYCGYDFMSVNGFLRNNEFDCPDTRIKIDRLSEILHFSPKLPENLIMYRAIDEKAFNVISNSIKEYNAYMEKGFMSTSLRFDTVVEEYGDKGYILKLYVPKGASVMGVDLIKKRSEEEMLFATNQVLIPKGDPKAYNYGGIKMIDLIVK